MHVHTYVYASAVMNLGLSALTVAKPNYAGLNKLKAAYLKDITTMPQILLQ